MSAQENILRSLTSSTSAKFDGALQILDIITEMVSDRIGASVCVTLYRREDDPQYRLLAIEDIAGLATKELPQLETFLDEFAQHDELFDRYLDTNEAIQPSSPLRNIAQRLHLERMYAHVFSPQNGDSAMIVSFMNNDERTGIVSARKVCQLAAQQFNVIFQFVELELRQLVVTAFMKVILRLSAMSFKGLSVNDALERIRRLGEELTGVTAVELITRDLSPDTYGAALRQFARQAQFVADIMETPPASAEHDGKGLTEAEETIVEADSSVSFCNFDDGSYVVGLERGPKPQWALQFRPTEFAAFSENESRLLKLFCSYSIVALSNYSLLRKQRRINEELRAAQERLVEAESLAALGDMASGVAHDFNNLLGGIVGRIELMSKQYDDPTLLKQLSGIAQLADDGAGRVKRLQEFAIATKPTNLEPFDICDLFVVYSSEEHNWSPVAKEKGITVSYSFPQNKPVMIAGKHEDIKVLLDSLIKNAIEATARDGSVEVALVLDKERATVSVRDTGRGIPGSIKNKIFNPFFSTKTDKGAGLGLSVAHGIAVRHGGAIKAESDESTVGATFTTSFPLLDECYEKGNAPGTTTRGKSLRVMVVDDDPQIREVLGDMLNLIDQRSDTFPDGFSALESFEKDKYDLVITDLGMPGMSGLELTEELKKLQPSLPVAMITGWGAQLNQRDMLEKGVFTVVAKPFYLKDVRQLVATVPNS